MKDSPARPACLGLRDYYLAAKKNPKLITENKWPAGLSDTVHGRVRELAKTADACLPTADCMLMANFFTLAGHLALAESNVDRVEDLASKLFSLQITDDLSPAAQVVPITRAVFCEAVSAAYRAEIRKDVEFLVWMQKLRAAPNVDPGKAEAELRKIARGWTDRARRIGEPALAYLLEEQLSQGVWEEITRPIRRQQEKLRKLIDVAEDPTAMKTRLKEVNERLKALGDRQQAVVGQSIAAAYKEVKTLMQLRTLDAVLYGRAQWAGKQGIQIRYQPPRDVQGLAFTRNLKQMLGRLRKPRRKK